MSRRTTPYRARSRAASGFRTRLAAALAALAVLAASVQASFGEICSLCPVDCPMHTAHGVAAPPAASAPAKIRCHGAEGHPLGVDLAFRRPPCRGSATLSTSLLPPFVLGEPTELPELAPCSLHADDADEPAISTGAVPETPPPISFA